MKRFLCCAAACLLAAPAARADQILHASVEVRGFASNSTPDPSDDLYFFEQDRQLIAEVSGSASGSGTYSSGGARAFAGSLAVYSGGDAFATGIPIASGQAIASWSDRVQIISPVTSADPPSPFVRLSFYITGYMTVQPGNAIPGAFFQPAALSGFAFSVTTGLPNADFAGSTTVSGSPGEFEVKESGWTSPFPTWNFGRFSSIFEYEVPFALLEVPGGGLISYQMSAYFNSMVGAGANSDFYHTGYLGEITFVTPQGEVTPESLGYEIRFQSGIPSPNIAAAVPEPSSLVLASIGGLGLIGYRWRRKRV